MKKLILSIGLFIFLFQSFMGYIYAQDTNQDSNKITCEQIWEIVDTDNCKRWVVSNSEGGVWCNLPDTRESLQPWIYGPPPTYTFIPGTCPVESGDQAEEESKSSQPDQTEQQTKQNKSNKNGNPFNIFAINPFEAWLKLKAVSDIPQLFADAYVDIFYEHALWGPGALEQLTIEDIYGGTLGPQFPSELETAITVKDEEEAWAFLPNYVFPDKENITVVKGQGQIKPPNSDRSVMVIPSDDMPEFIIYVDSIFTGATPDMVTLRYTWGSESGAVINVSPQSEVKFLKPTQDEKTQELKRMVKLNKGEIEVKIKQANKKEKFGIQTDFLDLIVIGTHFWIKNDPDRKLTLVGVYEGEVEVKTKDGKITTVSPNGDKPGVVVVVQKLSIPKLILVGAVLVVIIGGIVLFLKKRKIKTFRSKKKR